MHTQSIQSNIRAARLLTVALSLSLQAAAQDFTNIKDAKPFTINGSIGLSTTFYSTSDSINRQAPFTYGLNANLNMSLYGIIDLPFTFVWYNQQSSFDYPSFNRFGISPKYKWITAHFGHRNMRFSEYTMNGHTFLGAGVELTPGKFRLAALYGKFNENSDNDPYMADSIPRFTRKGWATKVGYGTDKTFVDISMLRITDDTRGYTPPINNDTVYHNYPTPVQNFAIGLTSKISFSPKFSFSFDGSVSVLTQNAGDSALVKLTGFGTSIVNNLITINTSSAYFTAFKTALAYKFTDKIGASLEYRRIDPEYQSLGAYFCNNDLEAFTINANAGLLNNKLMLRGSLGTQHDNLGKTKNATSRRTVGSFSGTYNFNQNLGVDVNYSNFSTNQRAGRSAIIDSLRLFQVNSNFSIMPRFSKVTATSSHFVMLNANWMQLDDKNKTTAAQTDTKTTILAANYSLGLLKSRTNLSFGLNLTTLENNMYEGKMLGGSIGVAQPMLKDKISLNWTNSLSSNKVSGNDASTFTSYLSVSFRPRPKHVFNFGLNYISNSYSNTGSNIDPNADPNIDPIESNTNPPSFNEIRGEIRYGYTF